MDFTEVEKAGSRMGTGTMIILDDQTCPVGMVRTWSISSLKNPAAGARRAGAGCIGQNEYWARWRKDREDPTPGEAGISDQIQRTWKHFLRSRARRHGASAKRIEILPRGF